MPDINSLSQYLKADSVKDGDIVNFIDPGTIAEREFKQKDGTVKKRTTLEMQVEINGDKKTYSPNSTTLKILKESWGTDTERWVGKQGRVLLLEQLSFGELKKILVIKPIVKADDLGLPDNAGT